MAVIWVGTDSSADLGLTGEMEKSGPVQDLLCWKLADGAGEGGEGERELGCLPRCWASATGRRLLSERLSGIEDRSQEFCFEQGWDA